MALFPDWTLVVELVFFVFLLWALNRILFKPILELIQRRRDAIEQKTALAEDYSAEAERCMTDYRRIIEEALAKADEVRVSILREAKEKQREIALTAQSQYEKTVAEQIESAKVRAEAMKRELEPEIEELARALAERLLS